MKGVEQLYLNNKAFKKYVDKYCRTRGVSTDEALKHKLVTNVASYYIQKGVGGSDAPGTPHVVNTDQEYDIPEDKSC